MLYASCVAAPSAPVGLPAAVQPLLGARQGPTARAAVAAGGEPGRHVPGGVRPRHHHARGGRCRRHRKGGSCVHTAQGVHGVCGLGLAVWVRRRGTTHEGPQFTQVLMHTRHVSRASTCLLISSCLFQFSGSSSPPMLSTPSGAPRARQRHPSGAARLAAGLLLQVGCPLFRRIVHTSQACSAVQGSATGSMVTL